jgi:hypothetical protein
MKRRKVYFDKYKRSRNTRRQMMIGTQIREKKASTYPIKKLELKNPKSWTITSLVNSCPTVLVSMPGFFGKVES